MSGKPVWLSNKVISEVEEHGEGSINEILRRLFVDGDIVTGKEINGLEERMESLDERLNELEGMASRH